METLVFFAILILLLPLFFERIHDDEAIYWSKAKSIFTIGIAEIFRMRRVPFAMLLVSPFLALSDSIFVPRIISFLFALASTMLIFEIVKSYSDEQSAFVSAILFIFSFQTIRFATRFYLDIYGVFFFLFSVYLIKQKKVGLAGLSFAFAMLSREIWFGLYPFMLIYLLRDKKPLKSFIAWSAAPVLAFLVIVQLTVGLSVYLGNSAFAQNLALQKDLSQIPTYLIQSWVEFLIVQIITVIGFAYQIREKKDDLLILILPQFLILSSIQSFILNGALTQYAMGLQASMALLGGPGITAIWKRHFRRYPLESSLILILILQFLLFSYMATALSLRGAIGIHDFGYWYDEKVISLLNEKAKNQTIVGLHGAFISNAKEWVWGERNVDKILGMEPDWYVIVEPQLINFKTEPENVKEVEVYRIGPYIILHSQPRGHLHELVEPNREFSQWAFRR